MLLVKGLRKFTAQHIAVFKLPVPAFGTCNPYRHTRVTRQSTVHRMHESGKKLTEA